MTVTVPPGAAPGTQYQFQIVGCTRTQCVTIPKSTALVVLPSASWVTKPYSSDYSKVAIFATPGEPFAATFMDSDNSMWNASEYSHNVIGVSSTAKKVKAPAVPDPSDAPSAFRKPFAFCGPKKCYSSSESALGESITTSNGWVWTTFGGWRVYANGQSDANKDVSGQPTSVYHRSMPPNRSEVVGYDPATGGFCVYLVPGSNTEVAGVAVTGDPSHPQVWFAASSGTGGEGSLDEFDPAAIGGGCNGRTTKSVVLPASVRKLVWPTTGGQWPTQIAIDPSGPTLWVSDFYGYGVNGTVYSEVDRIDISDPGHPEVAHRYVYPALDTTDYFGAKPWDIVAPPNSNYVYVADNGDAEIVRINKVTNQVDEASIPLTSDLENAFGLAFSSGRLYFTLADDFDLSFGRPSTFGYLDLSSWPADGPPTGGVIYTGLAQVTDRTWANYRGIAVGPTGQVALTDNYQMIRLTPR